MFDEFINKDFIYAIVGANDDPKRYGYIILDNLYKKGYKVVGVNPKYKKIDQVDCYSDLKSLPQKPDVVVFVVPPASSLLVLDEVNDLGSKKVWFQPGTYDEVVADKVKQMNLEAVIDGSCIMVVTNYK